MSAGCLEKFLRTRKGREVTSFRPGPLSRVKSEIFRSVYNYFGVRKP